MTFGTETHETKKHLKRSSYDLMLPISSWISRGSSVATRGQATVISLHETGKYILRLDGTRKQLLFEPDLGNHVPAGVWRILHGKKSCILLFCGFFLVRAEEQPSFLGREKAENVFCQGKPFWTSHSLGTDVYHVYS